jgi:hypothetical protein
MRRYPVISEICDGMLELGWKPYQNDHEDANGQFEMNWDYDDALVTADRHVFFKYMVKTIAEKHGLRATFMPKPFPHLTGNGCHAHVLGVGQGRQDQPVRRRARRARPVASSAITSSAASCSIADALCALFNPTVNSYKRINAPVTLSGATWSPNAVTYGPATTAPTWSVSRTPGASSCACPTARPTPTSAGRHPGRRPRRHRPQARPGQAARHQHVHRRPYGEGLRRLPLNRAAPAAAAPTCYDATARAPAHPGLLATFSNFRGLKPGEVAVYLARDGRSGAGR